MGGRSVRPPSGMGIAGPERSDGGRGNGSHTRDRRMGPARVAPLWTGRRQCGSRSTFPSFNWKQRTSSQVRVALVSTGLSGDRLELENTESLLLADSEATLETLHRLRELGVRISMDDFGTGYSSLSYLRSFPFDKIKIDRSFVNDHSSHVDSHAIVEAVIGLGRSLGMSTTAEGIETQEQLDIVRAQGCQEVQGFLFSPALPAAGALALIGAFDRSGLPTSRAARKLPKEKAAGRRR